MYKILITGMLLMLIGCQPDERYETITGEWTCVSWTGDKISGNLCDDNVHFRFYENKQYRSDVGGEIDTGRYFFESQRLIFSPEGKLRIGVGIQSLTQDSFTFIMSSAGDEERMTLIREN